MPKLSDANLVVFAATADAARASASYEGVLGLRLVGRIEVSHLDALET
jgi:catechol 2,3-dioxygenase-like lactoylglutathione lyase family enzyme